MSRVVSVTSGGVTRRDPDLPLEEIEAALKAVEFEDGTISQVRLVHNGSREEWHVQASLVGTSSGTYPSSRELNKADQVGESFGLGKVQWRDAPGHGFQARVLGHFLLPVTRYTEFAYVLKAMILYETHYYDGPSGDPRETRWEVVRERDEEGPYWDVRLYEADQELRHYACTRVGKVLHHLSRTKAVVG